MKTYASEGDTLEFLASAALIKGKNFPEGKDLEERLAPWYLYKQHISTQNYPYSYNLIVTWGEVDFGFVCLHIKYHEMYMFENGNIFPFGS